MKSAQSIVAFSGVCFIYAWGVRHDRIMFAKAAHSQVNGWDLLLSTVSDPHMGIYFAAPFILVIGALRIRRQANFLVLIRHGSRTAWLAAQAQQAFTTAACYTSAWALAGAVAAFGFSWEPQWAPASTVDAPINTVLFDLSHTGLSPATVMLVQCALFVTASTVTLTALAALHVWFTSEKLLAFTSLSGFLLLVVSFKVTWPLPELLRPVNYVAAFHALAASGSITPFMCAMAVAFVVLFVAGAAAERLKIDVGFLDRGVWEIGALVALILLGEVWFSTATATGGVWVSALVAFMGVSGGGFSLINFGYYIIVTLGFTYLVNARLAERLQGDLYMQLIRKGSASRWAVDLGIRLLMYVIGFILLLLVTNSAVHWAFASPDGSTMTARVEPALAFQQFFVNGALQLLVYVSASFVAIWAFQRAAAGLIAIGSAIALMVPGLNPASWLPSGLSSMALVLGGREPVLHATWVLLAWLSALLLTARLLLQYRDISFE